MANLEVKTKENPKLQQNTLSDGRISLYLEYYLGRTQWTDEETGKVKIKHDRKKESLSLYLIATPRTPIERQKNKETLELAKEIRAEREQQLKADRTGKRIKSTLQKVNFFDFFQNYLDNYTKKDVRHIKRALIQFKLFLSEAYPVYQNSIKPEQITNEMVAGFLEFLQSKFRGEGPHGLFQRFKKVIKYAVSKDVIAKNPCEGITCKVDDQTLKKDVLSLDEINSIIGTTYKGQNPEIRRAFIFCLYSVSKKTLQSIIYQKEKIKKGDELF